MGYENCDSVKHAKTILYSYIKPHLFVKIKNDSEYNNNMSIRDHVILSACTYYVCPKIVQLRPVHIFYFGRKFNL